jgi:hypothetical protein
MARGWESKSVEQQQEESQQKSDKAYPPLSSEDQKRNRKREGIRLSRKRLENELSTTSDPRRRGMLEQAIADLDAQLSAIK